MPESFLFTLTVILSTLCLVLLFLIYKYKKSFIECGNELKQAQNIYYEANDALFIIDILKGNILECNKKAAQLLGYSENEIKNLTIFQLHQAIDISKSSERIADAWEQKGLVYQDIPMVKANGEIVPVECSAKVFPLMDKPAIMIYARDITSRLKMENEIREQKNSIEQKNKDIIDSINSALDIQKAILPHAGTVNSIFPEHFILYKPKDIVSGDFYWVHQVKNKKMIAAVDCTGHGVPGSLISMVGHFLTNRVYNKTNDTSPSFILDQLRIEMTKFFSGADKVNRYGMDMALCCFDEVTLKLQYSGANNSLYVIRNNSVLEEYNADKLPIGKMEGKEGHKFTLHEINLVKNDAFYIFSDGYHDQFGGPKNKKFSTKRFKETLQSLGQLSMVDQKVILEKTLKSWQNGYSQTDDILVIGVKVS